MAAAVALALVCACDAQGQDPARADAPTTTDGITSSDAAAPDAGSDAATASKPTYALHPGVNPTGITGPSAYDKLEDGDDVQVEMGFQGFHMVVLALRTDAPALKPAWVSAKIEQNDEVVASAWLQKPELVAEPNGMRYAYDIFVITHDWPDFVDEESQIEIRVEDNSGSVVAEGETTVVVRGPPTLPGAAE